MSEASRLDAALDELDFILSDAKSLKVGDDAGTAGNGWSVIVERKIDGTDIRIHIRQTAKGMK